MTTYGYGIRPKEGVVGGSVRGADERRPIGPRGTGGSFSASRLADAFTQMFPDGWIVAAHIAAGTITANEIATGTLTADLMDVDELSAITADVGTLNAGIIQNNATPAPTAGIRLDSSSSIGLGWNMYLDLAATGSDPVLYHTLFSLNADGTAVFSGALSAATGSFAGSLSAATGTFAGSLSAATGSFAGSLSAATGTFAGTLTAAVISSGECAALGGFRAGHPSSAGPYTLVDTDTIAIGTSGGSPGDRYHSIVGTDADLEIAASYNGSSVPIVLTGSAITVNGSLDHDGTTVGFYSTTPIAQKTGYTTFSNLSTDRTCDANSTTVDELADILGTLIEDLKAYGLLGA